MKLYRKLNKVMKVENHLKMGRKRKKLSRTWMAIFVMMLNITCAFAQSNYIRWGTDRSSLDVFPSSGGQLTITIQSDTSWIVSSSETWLTMSPASGNKNGTVTVTVAPNTTTIQRTGIITIQGVFGGGTFGVRVSPRDAVNVEEETPVGVDSTGTILLNLRVPAGVLFTGTFQLQLPNGMKLDTTLTRLATHLASQLNLTIVENTDSTMLFTITSRNALRSSAEMTYSQIAEIVYKVDKTVKTGKHEAVIKDLSLKFDDADGTTIVEDKLAVIITVNSPTGSAPPLLSKTATYLSNGILYIQSPFAETVQIFSLGGMLINTFQKIEDTAIYPVNQLRDKIVIVKGSSGWTKKIIVQ